MPSPFPDGYGASSHRLQLPFRVSPIHTRETRRRNVTATTHKSHTFRGFFPYSVFPAKRSHLPPTTSHVAGYVTPPGFLTLSTFCSPDDLPGLFHPGPTHGVHPSRLFSLVRCRRPFRVSRPSWSSLTKPKHCSPPSRLFTPQRSRLEVNLSTDFSCDCPLGLSPSRVCHL